MVIAQRDEGLIVYRQITNEEREEKDKLLLSETSDKAAREEILKRGASRAFQREEIPQDIVKMWQKVVPIIRSRLDPGYRESKALPILEGLDKECDQYIRHHQCNPSHRPNWKAWHMHLDVMKVHLKTIRTLTKNSTSFKSDPAYMQAASLFLEAADQLRIGVEVKNAPSKLPINTMVTEMIVACAQDDRFISIYSQLRGSLYQATEWEKTAVKGLENPLRNLFLEQSIEEKEKDHEKCQAQMVIAIRDLTKLRSDWGDKTVENTFLDLSFLPNYVKEYRAAESYEDRNQRTRHFAELVKAELRAAGLDDWLKAIPIEPEEKLVRLAIDVKARKTLRLAGPGANIEKENQDRNTEMRDAPVEGAGGSSATNQPDATMRIPPLSTNNTAGSSFIHMPPHGAEGASAQTFIPSVPLPFPPAAHKSPMDLARNPIDYIRGRTTTRGYVINATKLGGGSFRAVVNMGTEKYPCFMGIAEGIFKRGAKEQLLIATGDAKGEKQRPDITNITQDALLDLRGFAEFPSDAESTRQPVSYWIPVWRDPSAGLPVTTSHSRLCTSIGKKTGALKLKEFRDQQILLQQSLEQYREAVVHLDTGKKLQESDLQSTPWLFNTMIGKSVNSNKLATSSALKIPPPLPRQLKRS